MQSLTIAFLQIAPCVTVEQNLEKGIKYCIEAAERGADIALFPEMWSIGYDIGGAPLEQLNGRALPLSSHFVEQFGRLAARLNMAIAVTLLERTEGAPRNTLVLFDRFGRRKLVYAKVHTCDFGDERLLARGDDFPVAEIDTACGSVRVGAMICYDREFPESARILMLGGAELILVPNACPMEISRLAQLRARAFENMTAVATCNYPLGVPDCNGLSSLFDGVAYAPGCGQSRDMCVMLAEGGEGVYLARLDLGMLRRYRRSEVHGNAYRRPEVYGRIVDEEVRAPFIRSDRR